jgi:N-acetylmuramoyl-L-alanine amidase
MDRGVKRAPFVVLIGANMPSILAEICFISNPQDEKLVRAPETRQAIAESLFEGVRSYAESLSGAKTAKTQDKIQE